jgi:hypothetical protein
LLANGTPPSVIRHLLQEPTLPEGQNNFSGRLVLCPVNAFQLIDGIPYDLKHHGSVKDFGFKFFIKYLFSGRYLTLFPAQEREVKSSKAGPIKMPTMKTSTPPTMT